MRVIKYSAGNLCETHVLSSQGFTTMILNCSQEMHNIGYAWRGLKEQLGEGIDEHIKRMTFLKGKTVRLRVLLKPRRHLGQHTV